VSHIADGFDTAALCVRGRRLSLDFVATLSGRRTGRSVERLSEPRDLSRWLTEVELLASAPRATNPQLVRARELREAIRLLAEATIAEGDLDRAALELVNRSACGPLLVPQLDASGAMRATPVRGNAIDACLGSIAADAVNLLGGPDRELLKECSSPTCALLFIDRSRGRRRRWCSMETCGNRAKTRDYRRRVKARAR
jgi:predicted RNA-binding Zn ribbon-like protein